MKTFVTSDLHFGHTNIMKFCPKTRGHFTDVTQMNEQMVADWNAIVGQDDLTYILGDVAFCAAPKAAEYLNRLNGRKILVEGNHDRKALRDPSFRNAFIEVHKYLEVNYAGHKICMFHYPIAEWNQMHRGSLHFYGHLHGNVSGLEKFRARDAGYDARGVVVTQIETLIADAVKGAIKEHH